MKIKKNGKVINLTEGDLQRIVKKVLINEIGMLEIVYDWKDLEDISNGDTFKFDGKQLWKRLKGRIESGSVGADIRRWRIVENPTGGVLVKGTYNVESFDPNTKNVTFNNGIVVGPEKETQGDTQNKSHTPEEVVEKK